MKGHGIRAGGAASYTSRLGPFLLLLIAAWGVIFYARTFDQKLLPGDEGVALMNAWRISCGEMPHSDFFLFIPPASFLPAALLFKIFGPSLLISRLLAFALAVLLAVSADLVLRRLGAGIMIRILSVSFLIPFGVSYWPIPSHHWWCDIFCLFSAYFFLKATEDQGSIKASAFAAGASLALAALCLQDQGGYFLVLAASICLPVIPRDRRKHVAVFSLMGLLAAALPIVLWLLSGAGVSAMFKDLLLFPLGSYHEIEGHKADLLAGWRQFFPLFTSGTYFGKAPFYLVSMTSAAFFLMLLPLASAASLFGCFIRKSFPSFRLAMASALAVSFFAAALHRWSFTNMVWAAPGMMAALALLPSRGRMGQVYRWAAGFFALTALVFSFSFFSLASPGRLVTISTRAGSLRVFDSAEARNMRGLLEHMQTSMNEGDTLFCGGFKGLINIFTLAKNPTPFNDFPGYNTPEHLASLEQNLRSGKVTWVCLPKTAGKPDEKLAAFVRDGYSLEFENNQYLLYRLSE